MPRLFVAIELPAAAKQSLARLCSGPRSVRWARPDTLHLTLRFIGEVDDAAATRIDAALGRIEAAPFWLTLAGVGEFRGHTLWAGVEFCPALMDLQSAIERQLQEIGLLADARPFQPHIKLGRSRRRRSFRDFLAEHAGFRAAPFEVAQFSLFESRLGRNGAVHERRATYPLSSIGHAPSRRPWLSRLASLLRLVRP